jgi:hypothetical protein
MHCQVAAGGADPTAAPECANRHANIIAGAAIPDAARQCGGAVQGGSYKRHSERAWARTPQLSSVVLLLMWRAET